MDLPPGDLPPPSYSEATITASATPSPLVPSNSNTSTSTSTLTTTGLPLPSPLTTHLRSLPARLRATQLARQTAQAAHDFDLTSLLVPPIEAFLADLTSSYPPSSVAVGRQAIPAVAELTLVPASAVPAGAEMSGAGERRREGEVVRVVRVAVNLGGPDGAGEKGEKGRGAEKGDGDADRRRRGSYEDRSRDRQGFDEWGRFDTDDGAGAGERDGGWWFRDEEMARRLAVYLRPEPDMRRKRVQAAVVEQKKVVKEEKSGWGRWGFGGSSKKKGAEQAFPVVPPPVSPGLPSPASGSDDDSVTMTVRAEEVTFRNENDFGVWESRTGWGIVVTVRVKP